MGFRLVGGFFLTQEKVASALLKELINQMTMQIKPPPPPTKKKKKWVHRRELRAQVQLNRYVAGVFIYYSLSGGHTSISQTTVTAFIKWRVDTFLHGSAELKKETLVIC